MLNTLYGLIGVAALLCVGTYALIRGGAAERYAMVVTALGWIASLALQGLMGVRDPLFGLTVIDLAAFVALLGLVWRSERRWPLAAVGFQGLAVGVDLVRIVSPHLSGWAYLTALAVAGYGLLSAIAVGTFMSERNTAPLAAND